MKRPTFLLVSALLLCRCAPGRPPKAVNVAAGTDDRCDIVVAALNGSYRIGGLDLTCVQRSATTKGRILVDASFEVPAGDGTLEQLTIPDCDRPPHLVRYAYDRQGSVSTPGVVSVAILAPANGKPGFSIGVDHGNWKDRRDVAGNTTYPISACGAANGVLVRTPRGWVAQLDHADD